MSVATNFRNAGFQPAPETKAAVSAAPVSRQDAGVTASTKIVSGAADDIVWGGAIERHEKRAVTCHSDDNIAVQYGPCE